MRNWYDSKGNRGRIALFSELPPITLEQETFRNWQSGGSKKRLDVNLKEEHLKHLTEKQFEVVIMRYWEGLSVEEIANKLGIGRRRVYSRLDRAYKKIRAQICI